MSHLSTRPSFRPGIIAIYLLLGFFGLLTLLPFLWMLCAAVKTQADFFTSQFLPPRNERGIGK